MSAVREAWTDDRLDDLSLRVDRGFDRVDTDLRELRTEMNTRFDAMQRTIILGFVSVLASIVSVLAGAAVTHI
jgi:hypothetical protein